MSYMPILPGTTVPVAATVDTAPVAGDAGTVGKFSWTKDQRRAWLSNHTGQVVFAKINAAGAAVAKADHQWIVADGAVMDLTFDGTVAVRSVNVSVWTGGTVGQLEVWGIAL